MQSKYPEAETSFRSFARSIIKDIIRSLNYKRKGLKTILGRAMQGDQLKIVVAHKDRLTRFGFDLIEWVVEQNGGKIVVLKQTNLSPEQETK